MPNWCHTYLTIRVPTHEMEALLRRLEGPDDWAMPSTQPRMMRKVELSAHQTLALDGLLHGKDPHHQAMRAEWVGKLRTHLTEVMGAPAWMPITREDLSFHWMAENGLVPDIYLAKIVPLSLPKLQPWDDEAAFRRYFPGIVDAEGFWSIDPACERAYNAGSLGPIGFRTNILGTKWAPGDLERHPPVHDTDGTSRVLFSYRTAWSPIDNLVDILGPTLLAHRAQALLFWQEEDLHSGWEYMDPARELHTADHWPRETHTVVTEDPAYPGDTIHEWDSAAMAEAAQAAAEADFAPLYL